MSGISIVRRARLRRYLKPLEAEGFNVELWARKSGIANWMHGSSRDWIPASVLGDALKLGSRLTGNEQHGFWLGQQSVYEDAPPIAKQVLAARTLREAIDARSRLIQYDVPHLRTWLEVKGDTAWSCALNPSATSAFVEQFTLMMLVRTLRIGLGPTWTPEKIRIMGEDTKQFERNEVFGKASIAAGSGFRAIGFPVYLLDAEISCFDHIQQPFSPEVEFGKIPENTLPASLREIIASHLPSGAINIGQAAEIAGMSERTLKRRLSSEDITYRELVSELRFDLARQKLEHSDVPISEIATDLGYSNVQNFYHAFEKWSGSRPGAYRRTHA